MISVLLAILLEALAASPWVVDLLGLLSDIVAPVVTALIGFVVWMHKRVAELEESEVRHDNSLYGTESDQLQKGVIREVKKVDGRVEETERRLDRIEDKLDELDD